MEVYSRKGMCCNLMHKKFKLKDEVELGNMGSLGKHVYEKLKICVTLLDKSGQSVEDYPNKENIQLF